MLVEPSGAARNCLKASKLIYDITIFNSRTIEVDMNLWISSSCSRFKNLKLYGSPPYIKWHSMGNYCETETGSRFPLKVVPRQDGLIAFSPARKKSRYRGQTLHCTIRGKILKEQVYAVLSRAPEDTFNFSITLPALTFKLNQLKVSIHTPEQLIPHQVKFQAINQEEFNISYYPYTVTLSTDSVPPFQVKTIEAEISSSIITAPTTSGGEMEFKALNLSPYISTQQTPPTSSTDGYLQATLSIITFIILIITDIIGSKQRGNAPYMFFTSMSPGVRIIMLLFMLSMFWMLSTGEREAESIIAYSIAVILFIRRTNIRGLKKRAFWSSKVSLCTFLLTSAAITSSLTFYHFRNGICSPEAIVCGTVLLTSQLIT